jgi:UPF0716 protein FxsA
VALLVVLLGLALPIAEIWLLILLGGRIGFWPTVGYLIGIGMIGMALSRSEGARVMERYRAARAAGRVPEEGLIASLLVSIGGLVLVIPGLITDAMGLLLLVPWTRRLIARWFRGWLERRIAAGNVVIHVSGVGPAPDERDDLDDEIIDVDATSSRDETTSPRDDDHSDRK